MRGSRGAKAVKPVMYHYVRPGGGGSAVLCLSEPRRLRAPARSIFKADYGFVDREAFVRWANGGPRPRGRTPHLRRRFARSCRIRAAHSSARGLFGLFYVSSGPAVTGRILDVHRVHLALGRLGSEAPRSPGSSPTSPEHLQAEDASGKAATPYAHQSSDETTKFLKWLFNWRPPRRRAGRGPRRAARPCLRRRAATLAGVLSR